TRLFLGARPEKPQGCSMPRSADLIEQALAFKQVEQRLLQQGTVVARQLGRVGGHRAIVFALAETEEAAARLDPRLPDQHLVVATARLRTRRQGHRVGLLAL